MSLPNPLARFAITAAQIDRVVTRFYAQVRSHPVLGPVFAAHVTDWPEHEAKIAGFWRNAILRERSYDGNPMRVHVTRPEIKPEHFAVWLGLFREVLRAELPEDIAAQWAALADRIGEGFRTGIVSMRQRPDEVPSLF
ncbi:group III truncated hemoglobin [Ruegeria aquimaris]|uniref:Group III truncated hemoglobin n=1 Tax=Ruegeria aquimaris TaxID=2984333 RepID=A0ABT3AI28_9RHOB|nr:group III truncated hemoglobin [Ruegeria sp. XHP0148]MCV2888314.1 group III truncated hemoglobin [Ruegeria sp. XHP0148]